MDKTRGGKAPSPLAHNSRPRVSPMRDSMTKPLQPPAMPHSEDGAPPSPLQRRYQTRRPPITPRASSSRPKKSISCPLTKKARVSSPVEPSEPPRPQPPTTESQIPSRMTPEVIISESNRLQRVDSSFLERYGSYIIQGDIHTLVSFEEGDSAQHVSSGCTPTLQHISTSTYGVEEGSYIGSLVQDIRGSPNWTKVSRDTIGRAATIGTTLTATQSVLAQQMVAVHAH
uniref:Uncharacterized protein n=1 Tax=Vitis vinifera TaxID=29760 RepID=A5C4I6_VITVI|nr:hypothetical protein VITISV_019308 [Vitis vinifera]